jgi:hypothetical protein
MMRMASFIEGTAHLTDSSNYVTKLLVVNLSHCLTKYGSTEVPVFSIIIVVNSAVLIGAIANNF